MAQKWSKWKEKADGKMENKRKGSKYASRMLYQVRRSWHEVYKILNAL